MVKMFDIGSRVVQRIIDNPTLEKELSFKPLLCALDILENKTRPIGAPSTSIPVNPEFNLKTVSNK